MKVTRDYVRRKFDEFNKLIFSGRLPEIPIELSDSGRFMGRCVYDVARHPDGRKEYKNFRLQINARGDIDEKVIEDTIIHEMIHYFIGYNGLIDSSTHGNIFKVLMNSINANFGRHLTITYKLSPEEHEQMVSNEKKWHILAVLNFRNGNKGLKVLPRNAVKVIAYHKAALNISEVVSVDLWLHNDPYFNRFPTSAALKYHELEPTVLLPHLEGARALQIIDGIRIAETRTPGR